MKISKLFIENVRIFENQEFQFYSTERESKLKVLLGENGSGKSSILKTIVYVLSILNKEYGGQLLGKDDIYGEAAEHCVVLEILFNDNEMKELFKEDATKLLDNKNEFKFKIGIRYKKSEHKYYYELDTENLLDRGITADLLKRFIENFKSHEYRGSTVLYFDAFRYYPNIKLEGPNKNHITDSSKELSLSNSIVKVKQGDNETLELNNRFLHIKQWIINLDFKRLKNPSDSNKEVFNHVIRAIERLYFPYKFKAITEDGKIYFSNGINTIEVDHLSDGFKTIFILVGEILYRLYHIDPTNQFFFRNEAVILIDEIDCHLHPKWQMNIIPFLKEMFPSCQFIVTTHSLFITNSLDKDSVIKLGEINHDR